MAINRFQAPDDATMQAIKARGMPQSNRAPGHVTEWADSGTPSTDLNFTRDLRLTRFKLGPFITLP